MEIEKEKEAKALALKKNLISKINSSQYIKNEFLKLKEMGVVSQELIAGYSVEDNPALNKVYGLRATLLVKFLSLNV